MASKRTNTVSRTEFEKVVAERDELSQQLEQAQMGVNTMNARMVAVQRQRNEALDKQAIAETERDALIQQFQAQQQAANDEAGETGEEEVE